MLDGTQSTEADVLSGMQQGTVPGPLFFLAFINDLPMSKKHSDARLFADDCRLYRHVTSSQDQALLQEDLSALERWEETWQMKFHPDKCTVIKISTNRKQILKINYHTSWPYIGGSRQQPVLGCHYQCGPHLEETHQQHSQHGQQNSSSSDVTRLGNCTAPVKAATYSTVVRPVLEYSSTVWDPHQNSDVHNLE